MILRWQWILRQTLKNGAMVQVPFAMVAICQPFIYSFGSMIQSVSVKVGAETI